MDTSHLVRISDRAISPPEGFTEDVQAILDVVTKLVQDQREVAVACILYSV